MHHGERRLGRARPGAGASGGAPWRLSDHLSALTINKVCGSGLKAVMLGSQGIATGDASVVVAGGMESMSNAPYLLAKAREGLRMGHNQVLDSMINDALVQLRGLAYGQRRGSGGDRCGIGRQAQDAYALESHRKAAEATDSGRFDEEILPVSIPQKKGEPIIFKHDESIRRDTTIEALGKLPPAFSRDDTVTAGNAPPVNDGAAALVMTSAAPRNLASRRSPSRKHRADSNRSTCS